MWQQCAVLGGGGYFFSLKYLFLISNCRGNATPMRAKLRPRLIAPHCGVAHGGGGGQSIFIVLPTARPIYSRKQNIFHDKPQDAE